ncbi:zinc finger matrin-type protein 1, partial [Salvelinus sp. IW2-2015]|uniref:zinc finger matrin-type protein 1 n=1 Tax=Salvelinus sp. IW2-2015 TaxID=2691554 RepID=UPI0038D3B5F3
DSAETEVDSNKCCTLCNMFFTSAIVASLTTRARHMPKSTTGTGETPSLPTATNSPTTTDSSPSTPQPSDSTPAPPSLPQPSSLAPPVAVVGSGGGSGETGKYCCLCGAWFNNPLMAQQHYEGKKHRRNAARAQLLEQLAGSLDATETTGLRSRYSCSVCMCLLNSIEQYTHTSGLPSTEQARYVLILLFALSLKCAFPDRYVLYLLLALSLECVSPVQSNGPRSGTTSDGRRSGASSDGLRSRASSDGLRSRVFSDGRRSRASCDGWQFRASSDSRQSRASSDGRQSRASCEGSQSGASGYDPLSGSPRQQSTVRSPRQRSTVRSIRRQST